MNNQISEKIYDEVRQRYAHIADEFKLNVVDSCCDSEASDCSSSSQLYDVDLSELPDDVTGLSLGCGDPITLAELQPGQTVLDLGSGGGIDCFLAARKIGVHGHVIGVDMTPEMLRKANQNKAKADVQNVEFRQGQIEALPVDSDSVNVIISNCVINLSPDKPAVFREAFRVLAPGGKLAVSDIVTQGQFSAEERADMAAWASCITGAVDVSEYVGAIRAAGFEHISVRDKADPEVELAGSLPALGRARWFSARVTAVKGQ